MHAATHPLARAARERRINAALAQKKADRIAAMHRPARRVSFSGLTLHDC